MHKLMVFQELQVTMPFLEAKLSDIKTSLNKVAILKFFFGCSWDGSLNECRRRADHLQVTFDS